jgi:hypothetical protein
MLYIPKFHRIGSEIHPNFPEIRPIRLEPNFFSKTNPKTLVDSPDSGGEFLVDEEHIVNGFLLALRDGGADLLEGLLQLGDGLAEGLVADVVEAFFVVWCSHGIEQFLHPLQLHGRRCLHDDLGV